MELSHVYIFLPVVVGANVVVDGANANVVVGCANVVVGGANVVVGAIVVAGGANVVEVDLVVGVALDAGCVVWFVELLPEEDSLVLVVLVP